MIKQLTNEELAQIRERVEKATKGPWETSTSGDGIKAGKYHIGVISKPHYFPYGLGTKEDATFIAHAREDIPKLLAEVERLKSVVSEIITDNIYHETDEEFNEIYRRYLYGGDGE